MRDGGGADTGRLRVLWVVKGLGPGGAEHLLVAHAAAHDRDAFVHHCAWLVPWKDHLVADLEAAGVTTSCLDGERTWDLRWLVRFVRLLRTWRPDVVHVHSPLVAALVRVVVRLLGRSRPRLVVTEHNDWGRHRPGTRWLNAVTYRLDDAHVAVSQGVADSVAPWAADGLEVLHHGIDVAGVRRAADRAAVRDELGLDDDAFVVGIVANYRREKDWPNLFAAAELAVAADPSLRVVAVGQGPLQTEVEAWHRASPVTDRVVLTGYRDDVWRVMSAFDVFTLASRHEGLPVVVMEALAHGLPVVATDVGGLREAVDDDVGLLVPPGDPRALADGWLALRDPARRTAIADRARARAEDFDVRRAVDALEDRYRRLARAAGADRRQGVA